MTTRREVLFALGALALLPACGGDDDVVPPTDGGRADTSTPVDSGGGGSCTSTTAAFVPSHGHALMVSAADIAAAVAKTYDVMGTSGHTHSVTLSGSDFARLASAGMVVVTSTNTAAHEHNVTVTCA